MEIIDIYKSKIETFRFYVNYMTKMIIIYLAVIGALAKFALDRNSTPQLFYTLSIVGVLFCIWTLIILRLHYRSARSLRNSLNALAEKLNIAEHNEDATRFCKFITFLEAFNYVIFAGFVVFAVIGPDVLLQMS